MLFHTWPFAIFLMVVLPVFFALRKTSLWLPWLTIASYFFYGWWNPYYLILVAYSTLLDYTLVALMDHCPREAQKIDLKSRLVRLHFDDNVIKLAFIASAAAALGIFTAAFLGPRGLRPALLAFAVLMSMMSFGALFSSRRIWLGVSLFNNLALLLFFKYARFLVENLNALFASLHLPWTLNDPLLLPATDGRADRARPEAAAPVPSIPSHPPPKLHRRRFTVPHWLV
jgi:D-alanyl-lipoteichoic acid acyltransferase DltB (MBOAT superfamily)